MNHIEETEVTVTEDRHVRLFGNLGTLACITGGAAKRDAAKVKYFDISKAAFQKLHSWAVKSAVNFSSSEVM